MEEVYWPETHMEDLDHYHFRCCSFTPLTYTLSFLLLVFPFLLLYTLSCPLLHVFLAILSHSL